MSEPSRLASVKADSSTSAPADSSTSVPAVGSTSALAVGNTYVVAAVGKSGTDRLANIRWNDWRQRDLGRSAPSIETQRTSYIP